MNYENDLDICPVCHKYCIRSEMEKAPDSRGIPCRLVCLKCYYEIVNSSERDSNGDREDYKHDK